MIKDIETRVARWPWQVILLVCIFGTTALLVLSEIGHQRVANDYQISFEAVQAHAKIGRVARRLAEAESGQRGYLLTRDPTYLESYNRSLPYFKPLFDQLTLHYTNTDKNDNESVDPRLNKLIGLTEKKLGELELTIHLAKMGKWNEAIAIVESGEGKQDMDTFRLLVDELQKDEALNSGIATKGLQQRVEVSRWTINGLALLNILLQILVMFWLRSESRRAQLRESFLDRMVKERTEQLAVLASHLQEVAEAEKARLGRELHDELGSILTASKMDLAWVKSQLSQEQRPLIDKLNRALKNMDQGIQIKRRIIEGLRPTTLASFGLVTAVRELMEQAAEQAGWTLDMELPDSDPDLSEEAEITLFRIVQESVTNISKYANANRVRVSVVFSEGEFCRVEVEDNGIGFRQTDVRPKAAGLVGMRERLRARDGKLIIESEPGKGTLIRAYLPVAEALGDRVALHAVG